MPSLANNLMQIGATAHPKSAQSILADWSVPFKHLDNPPVYGCPILVSPAQSKSRCVEIGQPKILATQTSSDAMPSPVAFWQNPKIAAVLPFGCLV